MRGRHIEDYEQKAVFDWAQFMPPLRWLHAIPNGGNRNPKEAARLKGQGVKPGVSDIFLPMARGGYHGLYIEMKRGPAHGRAYTTKEQTDFIDCMSAEGYRAVVCYGAAEAIAEIKAYLKL